jgi:hypothetical protein
MSAISFASLRSLPFVLIGLGASVASADFVVPNGTNYDWTRGATAGSAFAQWESFSSPAGQNNPDVGTYTGGTFDASAPAWNVKDISGGSFITSGGNIYAAGAPAQIRASVPNFGFGAGYQTTILVQVRTLGTEINASTVNLDGAAPTSTTELLRESFGGPGGFRIDTLYTFVVSGNAAGYNFGFNANETSLSLDRVAIDTYTTFVPAPASLVLAASGLVLAGRRRR